VVCYAIHDTSSVVGYASKYGPQALEIATTVLASGIMDYTYCFLFYFYQNKSTNQDSVIFGYLFGYDCPATYPLSKISVPTLLLS
jgi:hypothetical protein